MRHGRALQAAFCGMLAASAAHPPRPAAVTPCASAYVVTVHNRLRFPVEVRSSRCADAEDVGWLLGAIEPLAYRTFRLTSGSADHCLRFEYVLPDSRRIPVPWEDWHGLEIGQECLQAGRAAA